MNVSGILVVYLSGLGSEAFVTVTKEAFGGQGDKTRSVGREGMNSRIRRRLKFILDYENDGRTHEQAGLRDGNG